MVECPYGVLTSSSYQYLHIMYQPCTISIYPTYTTKFMSASIYHRK